MGKTHDTFTKLPHRGPQKFRRVSGIRFLGGSGSQNGVGRPEPENFKKVVVLKRKTAFLRRVSGFRFLGGSGSQTEVGRPEPESSNVFPIPNGEDGKPIGMKIPKIAISYVFSRLKPRNIGNIGN